MSNVPTPHIEAKKGDFANSCVMPGDPLRAKVIAETFLKNVKQVNGIRGMLGYTGEYNGKKVSVMASGMGMPSMGIYSYELFNFYDVKNIIRVGTAGAIDKSLNVGDIIVSNCSVTNSNFAESMGDKPTNLVFADEELVKNATEMAKSFNKRCIIGKLFTSDCFYTKINQIEYIKQEVVAVEMESFALLYNAKISGKKALAIVTISDNLVTGESANASARQNNFLDMCKLALELATRN